MDVGGEAQLFCALELGEEWLSRGTAKPSGQGRTWAGNGQAWLPGRVLKLLVGGLEGAVARV